MTVFGPRGLGLIAATIIAGLSAGAPAQAQFFGFGAGPFSDVETAPPRMIERRLARQGYRLTRPLRLNGEVLLADTIDPDGRRMRLVVDAYSGSVLQRFVTSEAAPERYANRSGGYDEPRVIQGPNSGYLENGSLAPSNALPAPKQLAPAARAPAPKAKPKTVARAAPPSHKPTALPSASEPAPAAVAPAPAAPPVEAPTAQSAPARVEQPNVSVSSADGPKAVERSPASKPAATTPKPGYANGVPINPLD
jgi:hypothetical protein